MSLFDPTSVPTLSGTDPGKSSTATTIVIFVIISALGSAVVVGFVVFGTWYRMKKRREQSENAIQLVELSANGTVWAPPPGGDRWG
jgi:hypothetical protein